MNGTINKWEKAQKFGCNYGREEMEAVINVIRNGAYTNGTKVRQFEKKFADYVGSDYAVAANSWVGAMNMLTIALNISSEDEIIVPALTFQASANIFKLSGAKIVFADVNRRTFNIEEKQLESLITPKTKAIVVVHMCGQPANMIPIVNIAKKYNLTIIQDAAHAHGALYMNKKLGEIGDYIVYSFHQGKNMSTLGEGGMIVTNNKSIADDMRKIRAHGAGEFLGISSRMTEAQGAVGLIQLNKIEENNKKRRELAYYLSDKLSHIDGIETPYELPNVYHVYHIYNILLNRDILNISRDDLIKELWIKGRIMAAKQYFPTVNNLIAYREIGYTDMICPNAEEISRQLVSLPVSPSLEKADMDEIIQCIEFIIEKRRK